MNSKNIQGKINSEFVKNKTEKFYKISKKKIKRPFFSKIVSDSNYWVFVSSNGNVIKRLKKNY